MFSGMSFSEQASHKSKVLISLSPLKAFHIEQLYFKLCNSKYIIVLYKNCILDCTEY